jgi:hypothetical protein
MIDVQQFHIDAGKWREWWSLDVINLSIETLSVVWARLKIPEELYMAMTFTLSYDQSKLCWRDRFFDRAVQAHVWGKPFPATGLILIDWIIMCDMPPNGYLSPKELQMNPMIIYQIPGESRRKLPIVRIVLIAVEEHRTISEGTLERLQGILRKTPGLEEVQMCRSCLTSFCSHTL